MTNLTTREPAEPVTNWWLWYTYPPWKIWVRLENIINKLLGTIKFMFQTTNQITIIFPLLLVYSRLTTINITINHHIPKHRVNHHQPGKFLPHIMMTYLPDPRRIEPRQNPLHKPFATYLSTAYFKRMFSGKKTSTDFKSDFGPTYPIMCSTSMLSWQDFKVEYYIWWHIIQCSKTPKFCYSNIRIPLPSPSIRKKSCRMGPPKIAKLPHKWLHYGLSVDITN